jgi:circadian clock protein KaiC
MNGTSARLLTESTGNDTFDALLGGGIPRRSLTIVAGEPGSGKTIFTLQMLFHAAQSGRKCLYFSTHSEPSVKLIAHMQQFAFFDGALMDTQLSFIDLGRILRAGQEEQLETITRHVEATDPAIVAIDGFRAIGDADPSGRRAMVHDLAVHLATWGTTVLLVGEYPRSEGSSHPEFGIADGIIRLGVEHHGLTAVREVEVVKLRGVNYVTGKHFCDLGSDGFTVYPRVRAPGPSTVSNTLDDRRSSTGIEGLDELLCGGLPELSTTVILGGTGAGKSLTALHFLLEGARRGERGVLFSLEETPEQIRLAADRVGLDLAAREREGRVAIQYSSPVELSTDRFLHEATRLVEKLGAKRAVFDSLTSMSLGVHSDRRFKELVYSIAKHLRHLGVTVLMTMESEQFVGSGKLTGHGVSFLADVLIQLRYVEVDGHLQKAISVVKARGIQHLTEMRELTVEAGKGGVRVTKGRFENMRGILTGVPTPS